MGLHRSQSLMDLYRDPTGPALTRTYSSRPTFATYMCNGGHWPSSTPCWPYAFSYYYPLSSSYFYYYKPWRLNHRAYQYYRTMADYSWDDRHHYYTPPQRTPEFYKNWRMPEDIHKPLYQNFCGYDY